MGTNADKVIDEIDAGTLKPLTQTVARALFRHIPLRDDLVESLLSAASRGETAENMARLQTDLWTRIDTRDADKQGALRLAVCFTRPEEVVDWHLAGYFVLWVREQGVPEGAIYAAFHEGANGS